MRSRLAVLPLIALLACLWAAPQASATSPSGVVISKLRLRTAASQFDEYVEIKNTTSATVDLSHWQLYDCFGSGGRSVGTNGDPLSAGTKLPAGQTFVFGKNGGDYTGTADATYNFQVTETGGFQVRDGGNVIQDAVGAPGSACAEGTGLTFPTTGSDFTFTRKAAGRGLQDTDDNAADFDGPSGAANGTACGIPCEPPPTPLAIDAIQGSGNTTPHNGQLVQITGVVIGVDNQQGVSNFVNLDPRQAGIYVETPSADQDADPATSEGIFVGGLGAADRSAKRVGQTVTVTGKVTELFNLTAIDATGRAPVFGARAALPQPVTIDPAQAAAQTTLSNGTRPYYESLEGMRVRLAVGTADSGGTDKFGELFLRPGTTRERVFRTAGFPVGPPDLLNLGQDAGSRGVDPTNPSHNPASTTRVNADLFDSVTDAVGPFGFAFSEYQIIPQPGAAPRVHQGPTHYPPFVPHQPRNTLRVANFNMENLFAAGMVDDGHTFTQREVDDKTTRLADAVGHILRRPDVVVTEEVASPVPLEEVARKLHGYTAIWRASTDARHIAVGLLVKDGVAVSNIKQLAVDATTPLTGCADNPVPGQPDKLFERPPLQVDVRKDGLDFTLIGNHLASQSHPEACRQAQADVLHDATAALEAAGRQVMVIGDLNDFEDSPALTRNLVAAGVTLQNLWSQAPADNRYSFQFDGQLQTLDHVFVTDGLHAGVSDVRYVHFDNDYFERDETHTAAGVSDHDPPLVTIKLPSMG